METRGPRETVFLHIEFFNLKEFHIEKIKNETLEKTHFFPYYRLNWLLLSLVEAAGLRGGAEGVVSPSNSQASPTETRCTWASGGWEGRPRSEVQQAPKPKPDWTISTCLDSVATAWQTYREGAFFTGL